MAGGFLGYIYVFAGCGVLGLVVLASVLVLYGVARVRAKSEAPARVRVVSVSGRPRDAA